MPRKKQAVPSKSDTEIRQLVLDYFYARNKNATSMSGKKGAAVGIRDVKSELKDLHGLSQKDVTSNLTYLISQGWIEERTENRTYTSPAGTTIPSVVTRYIITAQGIDKIDGLNEFTMNKFQGVKIEATGQNIITVGDGNQVNARFEKIGNTLADLRKALTEANISESEKLGHIADIDTIQNQLAKPKPNKSILKEAIEGIKTLSVVPGLAQLVEEAASLVSAI